MISVLLALCLSGWASPPLVLEEKNLMELGKGGSIPRLDEIRALLLQAQSGLQGEEARYSWEAYGHGAYGENRARPLISFAPVYSPTRVAEVGVRRAFNRGVSASLGVRTEQITGATPVFAVKNGTTTTLRLGVSMDLWQDLMGRASRARLDGLAAAEQRARIQEQVNRAAFGVTLRRLYWNLVANELARRITQGLLDQALVQSTEAKRRSANYIGDAADVARYEAQVSSRRSSLVSLDYEKATLVRTLAQLVPDLSRRDVQVAFGDLDATVSEVLACTGVIGAREDTPLEFTRHDEMIALLRQERAQALEANRRSGGPRVSLDADYRTTGVSRGDTHAGSIGNSWSDINENNRTGFQVALNAAVPLDGKSVGAEKAREQLEERRFDASIRGMEAEVHALHKQLKNNVRHLVDVIRYQKEGSDLLRKRLALERKKYTQARISVVDLVQDQDALLAAELDVVRAQATILETLFDYLTVFTDTPCDFNRKI